ncbi:MAG: F0F1 ATP synthase subunit gamma [Desulfoprunum sp.]|uniref:F0F1 ATP synthase subunit gamma n=1 Tax=Desulfoprunum sp. TaxID=2020866 RepID=UPI003C71BE71
MTDTLAGLKQKQNGARDLQSVVRAMKALAAASIGQYERSVGALAAYAHTVELGLSVCLRDSRPVGGRKSAATDRIGAIVFGSDQGLVGRFNEVLAEYALQTLATLPGVPHLWAVGERMQARLQEQGTLVRGFFPVPSSVKGITPLVGRILTDSGAAGDDRDLDEVYLFYNRPREGVVYTPVSQRLLPLDETWRRQLADSPWPTQQLPEVIGGGPPTLRMLIREFLFVSLFRACAESLASENASRLAAMQRADTNIEELLEDLTGRLHQLRQSTIDEELFDVVSGFEALTNHRRGGGPT